MWQGMWLGHGVALSQESLDKYEIMARTLDEEEGYIIFWKGNYRETQRMANARQRANIFLCGAH